MTINNSLYNNSQEPGAHYATIARQRDTVASLPATPERRQPMSYYAQKTYCLLAPRQIPPRRNTVSGLMRRAHNDA